MLPNMLRKDYPSEIRSKEINVKHREALSRRQHLKETNYFSGITPKRFNVVKVLIGIAFLLAIFASLTNVFPTNKPMATSVGFLS